MSNQTIPDPGRFRRQDEPTHEKKPWPPPESAPTWPLAAPLPSAPGVATGATA